MNELRTLDDVLGKKLCRKLLGLKQEKLTYYQNHPNKMSNRLKRRVDILSTIVRCLVGSYNFRGVRRWFKRPRTKLGGKTPGELFIAGRGNPNNQEVKKILSLAQGLAGTIFN